MKEIIKEWGSYLLIIIVIVLLRKYIITPVIVKGTSMEPNLENNQILLLSKISYKLTDIKRFDIVVIQEDNDYIIKRVIGLPGETLEYQDNKLYINDKEISDPYAKNKTTDATNEENKYLVFITKSGLIKRTAMEEFDSIRNNGKKAIILKEDDELIAVRKTDGNKEIIIGASNGRLVRFYENEVRIMGRGSSGVKGIDLSDNEFVVGAEIVTDNEEVLVVTENGYGKKTPIDEYRRTHRGSKGVKTLNITEKNGNIVSLKTVLGNEDLIIITDVGMTIRISVEQISTLSRNTQGVRLITLKNNQKVSTIASLDKLIEENIEE